MSLAQQGKRESLVVLSYSITTHPWEDIVYELLRMKQTGSLEMHVSQGTVCAIKWMSKNSSCT